jgi:transposase
VPNRDREYLPHDFPPRKTVYDYYAKWEVDGTTEALHDLLRERVRVAHGRATTPAAIIDRARFRWWETGAESACDGASECVGGVGRWWLQQRGGQSWRLLVLTLTW